MDYPRDQQNEYEANRRDEAYDQAEENKEPLLKKLMPDFSKYFHTDDEAREEARNEKFYWDAKYGV